MERTCKIHGYHLKWRRRRTAWLCRYCIQANKRSKRIARNYNLLLSEYDQDIADRYLAATKLRTVSINEFRSVANKETYRDKYPGVTRSDFARIQILNAVSRKPAN